MSKNNKTTTPEISEKQLIAALLKAAENQTLDKPLIAVLNRLFESGQWEIPDDAIVGIYSAKIDQMEAMIKAQADNLKQLAAEVRGTTPPVTGRVDALESAKPAPKNGVFRKDGPKK